MRALGRWGQALLMVATLGFGPALRAQTTSAEVEEGRADLAEAARLLDERRPEEALARFQAALRQGQPAEAVARVLGVRVIGAMQDSLRSWADVVQAIVVLKAIREPEVRVALDFLHGLALFNQGLEIRGTNPDPGQALRARALWQIGRRFLISGRSFGASVGYDVPALIELADAVFSDRV